MERMRSSIIKVIVFFIVLLSVAFISKDYIINYLDNINMSYIKYVFLGGDDITIYVNDNLKTNGEEVSTTSITAASGILTYIDYETNIYGAIGHSISDDNKDVTGMTYASEVLVINKSTNAMGNKITTANMDKYYGTVYKSDETGVYGIYEDTLQDKKPIQVAMPSEVHKGSAHIVTSFDGEIQEYEINIISINMFTDTKNIYFEVVDQDLINKTNGIIRGMSGSPIVQDGKIIGALSHSKSYNYLKGNAIFITNMLK